MIRPIIAAGLLAILAGCGISQPEFRDAAAMGDAATVRRYIEEGGDVNAPRRGNVSALMLASLFGNTEVVDQLLKAGADINYRDSCGQTALSYSLLYESPDCMGLSPILAVTPKFEKNRIWKLLLDVGADPNTGDDSLSATPLFIAAVTGDPEKVAALLNAGADADIRFLDHTTALSATGDEQVAAMLLKKTSPELPPNDLSLIAAACGGNAGAMSDLLDRGANANAADHQGMTPLMHVALRAWPDMVKILLEAGADPNLKDQSNRSALWHAAAGTEAGYYRNAGCDPKVIELLLNAGARQSDYDPDCPESSEFILAVNSGKADAVKLLIDAGPDPEALGPALIWATWNKSGPILSLLLDAGADPNYRDKNGDTPLLDAASSNKPNLVRILLAAGADPAITDKNGMTAMDLAGRYESDSPAGRKVLELLERAAPCPARNTASPAYLAAVRRWLDHGGNIDYSYCNAPFLSRAVKRGDLGLAKMLLDAGADPNIDDPETPLQLAVERNDFAMAELLLSAGANPDDGYAGGPLQKAIRDGNIAMASMLLHAGADPLQENYSYLSSFELADNEALALLMMQYMNPRLTTPDAELIAAVIGGNTPAAKSMLAAGANPDAATPRGITVLMQAAGRTDVDTMKMLLDAGADPQRRDDIGRTALHHCIGGFSSNDDLYRLLFAPAAIKLLLDAGADPNAENVWGHTPLQVAAGQRYDTSNFIRLLLNAGANPNCSGGKDTPLKMVLLESRYHGDCYESVRLLLEAGADLPEDENLLVFATSTSPKTVKLLLDAGADINMDNGYGWNALNSAAKSGNAEMVRFLLDNGADPHCRDKDGKTALNQTADEAVAAMLREAVRE